MSVLSTLYYFLNAQAGEKYKILLLDEKKNVISREENNQYI
jgi:hypothetical protein